MKKKMKKTVVGFSAVAVLMLGLLGATMSIASAQGSEAMTRTEVAVEEHSFNFERVVITYGTPDDDGGGTSEGKPKPASKPAGDCSGAAHCSTFAKKCRDAGGEFDVNQTNGSGQPTSGTCD